MSHQTESRYDITLSEALSDPLTQSVMRADGVQRVALEHMLNTLAHRISLRENVGCSHTHIAR